MVWHITDQIEACTSYEVAREEFTWDLPADYNIAHDTLRKHDDQSQTALYQRYQDGTEKVFSFRDLDEQSNKLANVLVSAGVSAGDRVAIIAPQIPPTALTYLACWKIGAICVPVSVLYGEDGVEYRLGDSGAKVAIVHASREDVLLGLESDLPDLETIIGLEGTSDRTESFDQLLSGASSRFSLADTGPETPAIIQYTSGTTDQPKGALLKHSTVPGWTPGLYMMANRRLPGEEVVWAPADWAWVTGPFLFTSTWHYGRPLVGYPMGSFDAHEAFELMNDYNVKFGLFPPTALRMMRGVDDVTSRYNLSLKVICGSGEPITNDIYKWVEETFDDVLLTEAYGQTEADPIVTDCPDWFEVRQGSMGRPIIGHDVAVIDADTGEELPPDEVGEIALRYEGDPVVFEEYWNDEQRTVESFLDEWYLTGDLAVRDEDGYFWYKGRADDIIITSGYRVGPDEVEDAILNHPAVAEVGVIGVPDDLRGERIKAFIQLAAGESPSEELKAVIKDQVKDRLAKYEYPREIEFVDDLPMTTTGKIRRVELREREGIN